MAPMLIRKRIRHFQVPSLRCRILLTRRCWIHYELKSFRTAHLDFTPPSLTGLGKLLLTSTVCFVSSVALFIPAERFFVTQFVLNKYVVILSAISCDDLRK